MDFDTLPVRVQTMTVADLSDVLNIEHVSFPSPWSSRAYEYELRYNEMAHYFVACAGNGALKANGAEGMLARIKRVFSSAPTNGGASKMVGYVGYWLMAGEAHISTIAVRPEMRGHSYGELLLAYALQDAAQRNAHVATLEVRVSNLSAQQLYLKYGFEKVGLRKAYYSDNNEDAYIMTTPPLNSAAYQQKYQQLKQALVARVSQAATAH